MSNHGNTFTFNSFISCKKYSLQLAPIYNGTAGHPKEVKFETFPDDSFFAIKETANGIQYSHDGLAACNSIKYITYKMAVKESSAETAFETVLKPKASFFEIESRKGVQTFSVEDISREIVALAILGTCKAYQINITAEVEGTDNLGEKIDV